MKRRLLLLTCLATCLVALQHAAQGQSSLVPTPVLGDARMVTFDYDDDRIYKVLVRPRNTTQLKLGADEKVTYVSAGDASNFIVTVPSSKAFVEVKPKWENVSTNLLVVTTRRSYHVDLQSTADGRKWYTRVAWTYTDGALLDQTRLPAEGDAAASGGPPGGDGGAPGAPVSGVAVEKLFFQYQIDGDAAFRPVQVFDDGTHTYLRLPDGLQELPALFMRAPDTDETVLVNYSVTPPYLVVPRTMEKFVLKLGKARVDVLRQPAKPGFWARLGFGRQGGR